MKKEHVYEMINARKYYHTPVIGSVLLVDGQVHSHAPTVEIRRMYNDLVKTQKETLAQTKVYVVVTLYNDGEREYFCDVVLITRSKTRAARLALKLQSGKKIKGFEALTPYEKATFFERSLEDLSIWKA